MTITKDELIDFRGYYECTACGAKDDLEPEEAGAWYCADTDACDQRMNAKPAASDGLGEIAEGEMVLRIETALIAGELGICVMLGTRGEGMVEVELMTLETLLDRGWAQWGIKVGARVGAEANDG